MSAVFFVYISIPDEIAASTPPITPKNTKIEITNPIAEITIPAIARPLPLPPSVFDLLSPIMLKMSPRIGKKNEQINPAIAIPFDRDC